MEKKKRYSQSVPYNIISPMRGGLNSLLNIVWIRSRDAENLRSFHGLERPDEQIWTLLEIAQSVFTEKFLIKIQRILKVELRNIYIPDTWNEEHSFVEVQRKSLFASVKQYNNVHHIIPRSRGGSNESHNLLWMDSALHSDLHRLYYNNLPHEQIRFIVRFSSNVLQPSFSKAMLDLVNIDWKKIYSYGVFMDQSCTK